MMSSLVARYTVICAVLTYAFSASSLAAGPGPSSRRSQPATSQPGGRDSKPRLAVLDFKVEGKVEASGSKSLAAVVRDEFHRSGRYDLMTRQMTRKRLGEKGWAASVECDEIKCLVKCGTSLDVQKIVGGLATSLGRKWVLTIRLVDVNTGREEKLFTREHDGEVSDLLGIAREGARELLGMGPPPPPTPTPTLTLDCGNGVTMELVQIPAGKFTMGSNDGDSDEKPPHEVTISKPFYMGKYEVTQAQWQAVMGSNPSNFKGDDLPVEMVSWDDCQEFCKKLSTKTGKAVRLPTEAEWEYACRAGSTGKFCFGDNDSGLDEYAWLTSNSGGKTHPVGQKKVNAWDLYDMHGNVWEWCADWYDKYPGSSATSDWFGQKCRVLRGGSWLGLPADCRSAVRLWVGPVYRVSGSSGFRLAAGTQ